MADYSTNAAAGSLALTFIIVGAALYLLPTIIAVARKCRNVGPVVIINLFLGWTFIGWVVALAMAFGQTRNDPYGTQVVQVYPQAAGPMSAPPPVSMSPDGRFWWDGAAWRDTDVSAPPTAPRSDDGRYWWDGIRWRTVPAGGAV